VDSVSASQSRSFLKVVLGLLLALYLLPWFLIRTPHMEDWAGSIYGAVMDYGYDTAGLNADVLLVGDSSLIMGVDPGMVSRALGLKVISLPNTIGSLRTNGEIVLNRYLKANRPPRLIVMYLNPWNLDYSHSDDGLSFYEGEEMMLRHGTAAEVFQFFLKHPTATLEFPYRFYLANPKNAWETFIHHRHPGLITHQTGGHYNALYMFGLLTGPCTLPSSKLDKIPMDSAREFLAEYNTPRTRAVVYLAPLPDCTNADVVTQRSYAAIGTVPPKVLPASDFLHDPFYAHVQPGGVADSTRVFTAFLRIALASQSASGTF
jgi:hypothetical protein